MSSKQLNLEGEIELLISGGQVVFFPGKKKKGPDCMSALSIYY